MIKDYAEFREVIDEFCKKIYGVIPHDVDAESRCEALWERLSLRDYTEKLYILSREDVRMIAEQDGDRVGRREPVGPVLGGCAEVCRELDGGLG
jgi:hypothetical protein